MAALLARNRGAAELRRLLNGPDIIVAPGVYDGLSAKIVEQAGFKAAYGSGGAISRSKGYPDVGLLTLTEMVKAYADILDVIEIPLIADADTGYGNAINVIRTVRQLERIGVAGFHLEDQVTPKKCGHYEGKQVVPTEEMVQKIKAACDARQNDDLVIIARTDARSVLGLDEAIERAHRYVEAGADVIFVESPESVEEIERIAREISAPLLINMFEGGKTPLVNVSRLHELGFKIVIVPSDLQRAAMAAMMRAARTLMEEGSTHSMSQDMATFKERDQLIGLPAVRELEARYLSL